jgi:hypothetical protein
VAHTAKVDVAPWAIVVIDLKVEYFGQFNVLKEMSLDYESDDYMGSILDNIRSRKSCEAVPLMLEIQVASNLPTPGIYCPSNGTQFVYLLCTFFNTNYEIGKKTFALIFKRPGTSANINCVHPCGQKYRSIWLIHQRECIRQRYSA